MSTPNYYDAFKGAVETLFNNWTALQLAVDQGMGGQYARQTALEMVEYVAQYCCSNNVDSYDLETLLEDIMDEKFDTVCEDNSPQELAFILARFIGLCRAGSPELMLQEVSQLPTCKLWLCQPQVQQIIPIQPNEIVEDDDEGNEDNQDEAMEEDPDPGWTVVKTKKKH